MIRKALIFSLIMAPVSAFAAEADHYTLGDYEIADITQELNDYSNYALGQVLERLNQDGGCSAPADQKPAHDPFMNDDFDNEPPAKTPEEKLYAELRTVFANHGKSRMINDILDGRLARTVIPLKESVYGEWSVGNGFLLGRRSAASSPLALSPLIKVNGYVIGVDKLEHMFGMGYAYFKRHHIRGMKMRRVLKLGVIAEKTYLGGNFLATGVFTYADLSANFNGMRFWNHMLQKDDDVLGKQHNLGPYVTCEAGQWKKANPIDFSNYVDRTYQENYNCSKFATQKGVEKFKESLGRLEAKHGKTRGGFACPADPALLEEAAAKYKVPVNGGTTIDHWIVNRDGNEKVSYFNEF